MGINESFSANPMENIIGMVTGTASWTQFPSGTAKILSFKAHPSNLGFFDIAEWDGDQESYWPLDAGEQIDWFAGPHAEGNLKGLQDFVYRNTSGSSDRLTYWIQR